jgi:glutathione S-transferase
MKNTLLIGDYAYSSWSLRGWLMFRKFGLPVDTVMVDFDSGPVADQMQPHFPARTVPTWITPEGVAVSDSLAIAEELATRHPEAGHWPRDPALRALARMLACEMHCGFGPLRQACPMNLRTAYRDVLVDAAVKADLGRIAALWIHAIDRSGGPWLCGDYCIADAFFAPVAARIAGYSLPVPDRAAAYVAAHLDDPAFREWRSLGLAHGATLARYAKDWPQIDWPAAQAR